MYLGSSKEVSGYIGYNPCKHPSIVVEKQTLLMVPFSSSNLSLGILGFKIFLSKFLLSLK